MDHLKIFLWLFWMSITGWVGLAILVVGSLVLLRSNIRAPGKHWLAMLPVIWVAPLVIATCAWDFTASSAKTASWVVWTDVISLPVLAAAAALLIYYARGVRVVAMGWSLINGLFALMSAFVVLMAASGDWI